MALSELIASYLDEVGTLLFNLPQQPIQDVAEAILTAYQYNRTIYVAATAESALVAASFVRDLQKRVAPGRPRIKAIALADNLALFSDDVDEEGYDHVFPGKLRTSLNPGDILLAITGDGRSVNLHHALQLASDEGAITIGLTGSTNDNFLRLTNHCIVVPSEHSNQTEDIHFALCHAITEAVRRLLQDPGVGREAQVPHAIKKGGARRTPI